MDADKTPTGDIAPAEMTFAREVQRRRKDRGWSQSDLAERMRERGITYANQSTVSRIEQLTRPVRMIEAQAIASIFDTSLTVLTFTSDQHAGLMARIARTSKELSVLFTRFVEACRLLEEARPSIEQVYRQEYERNGDGDELPTEVRAEYRQEMSSIRRLLDMDLHRFIPDGWPKAAVASKGRRRGQA